MFRKFTVTQMIPLHFAHSSSFTLWTCRDFFYAVTFGGLRGSKSVHVKCGFSQECGICDLQGPICGYPVTDSGHLGQWTPSILEKWHPTLKKQKQMAVWKIYRYTKPIYAISLKLYTNWISDTTVLIKSENSSLSSTGATRRPIDAADLAYYRTPFCRHTCSIICCSAWCC